MTSKLIEPNILAIKSNSNELDISFETGKIIDNEYQEMLICLSSDQVLRINRDDIEAIRAFCVFTLDKPEKPSECPTCKLNYNHCECNGA